MTTFFNQKNEKVTGKIYEISVNAISPNPHQPRKNFSEVELRELSVSISENGILQPLSVRKIRDGVYELISGERRLRAAKLAGLSVVPCIQVDTSLRNAAILSLMENIQRQDLNCFEEAAGIAKLIDFYGITQEETAQRLGKSQSAIANKLRLLKLSDAERRKIAEYGLSERHARALLTLGDRTRRLEAIEKVHENRLNVSQTEDLVHSIQNENISKQRAKTQKSNAIKPFSFIKRAVTDLQKRGYEVEMNQKETDTYILYTLRVDKQIIENPILEAQTATPLPVTV